MFKDIDENMEMVILCELYREYKNLSQNDMGLEVFKRRKKAIEDSFKTWYGKHNIPCSKCKKDEKQCNLKDECYQYNIWRVGYEKQLEIDKLKEAYDEKNA